MDLRALPLRSGAAGSSVGSGYLLEVSPVVETVLLAPRKDPFKIKPVKGSEGLYMASYESLSSMYCAIHRIALRASDAPFSTGLQDGSITLNYTPDSYDYSELEADWMKRQEVLANKKRSKKSTAPKAKY